VRTADELWDLLEQARRMPYGAAQIALVEQILRQVDEAGDPDLAFTARLIGTTAYVYGGEKVKSFVTFSWCLSDFDNHPGPHHERHLHTLLWHFKYMINALRQFPEIPLARTYAVLDDMERRYREAGYGLQVVHKNRYFVADHVGRAQEADEWYARWQSAPRDGLSDCAGCDPSDVAGYLNSRDRYSDVIEVAEPVLAGKLNCTEQPQGILRELSVAYLRTGELDKAADAHRRAYRLERGNLADLWNIGTHIAFCGRTGNEHRGLEMLQRHIDWLEKAPSPAAEMNFAADSAMLLRRLTELGHGDLPVRRRDRDEISVADLATEMADRATSLAVRFDTRNGTGHQGELIAEKIAARPYGIDIPLSPTARTSAAPASVPDVPPVVPAAADPAELLDLATEQFEQERPDGLAAALDALAERFPVLDDPLLEARRVALTGNRLRLEGDDAALDKWDEAARLFEAAGASGEAIVVRARAGFARAFADPDADISPLQADVDHQESNGDPAGRAAAWARMSILHLVRRELDEAVAADDRAYAHALETGDPRLIARHAMDRARVRGNTGDYETAAAAARTAWEFYRAHGSRPRLADVATLHGNLADDPAVQVEAFGAAIATGVDEQALPARVGRGRALLRLGRADDAIADLVEAVAICTERGLDHGGVHVRQELAEAYAAADRPFEAAEVAEEALRVYDELGENESGDNTRFLLARQYHKIGDTAGAVVRYQELISRLADNPAGRGQVGEEAAGLLYDLDRDAEAADAFRAAAADLHEAGDLIGELRALRRRVSALHYADEPAEAIETAQVADERFASLPDELAAEPNAIWQNALTAFEHARVLMSRGRYAEALPLLPEMPGRLRAIGAHDDADRLAGMYGEALLRSGAPVEAEAYLADLLAGMAPDAPGRELAERVHAEARDAPTP
jgi:cellulose synthase operon protein C